MSRLRFGTQVGGAATGTEWLQRASDLEALGYDTIQVADHVVGTALAPFPALAAAAAVTTRVRLGQLVLDNDFRNPLIVARETLSLDVISNGRAELGLGAGWHVRDYESLGIPFVPGRVRVERLGEAVEVIKRLFAEEEVTHEGRFYRLKQAQARPAAVQRPRPPILIAGGGRRILSLAAREADIVAPIPRSVGGAVDRAEFSRASLEDKLAYVERERGGRPVELNLLIFNLVVSADRGREVAELARRFEQPAEVIADSPFLALGSLAEIRDQLADTARRYGIGYITVRGDHVDAFAPVARELVAAA